MTQVTQGWGQGVVGCGTVVCKRGARSLGLLQAF